MNRYVIEGIARDAAAGKNVLCVIPYREVEYVLAKLSVMPGVMKTYRAHGRQSVTFDSGATVRFADYAHGPLRGITADIVVLDDIYYMDRIVEVEREARAAVSATGGHVVCYT